MVWVTGVTACGAEPNGEKTTTIWKRKKPNQTKQTDIEINEINQQINAVFTIKTAFVTLSHISNTQTLRGFRPLLSSLQISLMASITSFNQTLVPGCRISNPSSAFLSIKGRTFPSISLQRRVPRFQITCAAKPETVKKVCDIVKKQLALPDESAITGESKFSTLGADSLDTVEIVMGLEEEFGISVEEESAQSITTVQEAADMIDKLLESKSA
ncbi:Acyl carrier protein 1 [Spatholobus suberectus]|nr:Acyl carrier protein 1 [Spatholobus suberectus]